MNASAPAVLVCLDLQRARLSHAVSQASATRAAAACRQVLDQARARRWPVVHVHRREVSPQDSRPIQGLEPLPSEPVYVHSGPSAFSNGAFAQSIAAMGGPLALIGFSLNDSVLATAFAAVDRQLPVEILQDAVAANARDELGLRQAMAASLKSLSPLCRIIDSPEFFQEDAAALAAANAP